MAQLQPPAPGLHRAFDLDSLIDRITGTVTFRRATVARIAADHRATLEAGIVVGLVGVATAIGYRTDLVTTIAVVLIAWLALAGSVAWLTTNLLGGPMATADVKPLLRTIGYALAPGVLSVFHVIWVLGPIVTGIGTLWSFLATIFAVRVSTRLDWPRTLAVTILAGIVVNVLGIILRQITGAAPHIW